MNQYDEDPKIVQLCEAAKTGDADALKKLLDSKTNVDARDRFDGSPLYYACMHGHPDLVRLLLSHGADTCQRDAGGFTPLHWASMHKNGVETLKLLLEYGKDRVDINDRAILGDTPLRLASDNVDVDTVQFLLAHGADMEVRDRRGNSPIYIVLVRHFRDPTDRILDLFIEHNAEAVFEAVIALPEAFTARRERLLEWYRENKPDLYFEKWCQTSMAPG